MFYPESRNKSAKWTMFWQEFCTQDDEGSLGIQVWDGTFLIASFFYQYQYISYKCIITLLEKVRKKSNWSILEGTVYSICFYIQYNMQYYWMHTMKLWKIVQKWKVHYVHSIILQLCTTDSVCYCLFLFAYTLNVL